MKWFSYVIDAAVAGVGVYGAVSDDWLLAGIGFGVAAIFIWMDVSDFWKPTKLEVEPAATDAASAKAAEELKARTFDVETVTPEEAVASLPTGVDFVREVAEARADGIDIEALWKNRQHREDYPECRYCTVLDEEKAAADKAEPGAL